MENNRGIREQKYGKGFTESECEEIFDLLDLNKDGEIDYAEFTELWKFQ